MTQDVSTNFDFMQAEWPDIYESATMAEANLFQDPRAACFYARRALEHGVEWLYRNDDYLQMPKHSQALGAMINEQSFKENLDHGLMAKLVAIQRLGNIAVHQRRAIESDYSLQSVKELFHFCYFIYRYYASASTPKRNDIGAFNLDKVPRKRSGDEAGLNQKQLLALQADLAERDEHLRQAQAQSQAYQQELAQLRAEMQGIKAANQAVQQASPDTHDYNEADTRAFLIDLLLAEAGWDLNSPESRASREYPVTGMPKRVNASGKGAVDYVLWGKDGLPLAIVEAKRTSKDPKSGERQAECYADCLEQMTGQRPFIFYTNGYEIFFWDDTQSAPRPVAHFYTPDALERLLHRRGQAQDLHTAEVNTAIAGRYYQIEAIRRIAETFQQQHRHALVVMATGTGKTRTAVALVDLLMRAGWVQRVLFLADRTALVKQAQRAFKTHLPDASTCMVSNAQSDPFARLYFSTYPTMLNAIEHKRFGVGHFDLVIIDEAHRSVYQKYGAIFEYFDALLLGLTATPRDEVDRNTYQLFALEAGIPTYAYESEQAFDDGFLVPPQTLSVPLKFQRHGIHYADLTPEEQAEYELTFEDEDGQVPDKIDAGAINQWLFNQDTVDQVLRFLMEEGLKVAGGDQLGKTIVFAKNHDHAAFIAERFNLNYPHYKGKFARVIDNYERFAEDLIEKFSMAQEQPVIAVSVDMLDTGIDVPEILNLVFFKTVYSKTKFHQMMGRGTRLCPDLFGPGQDKQAYLALDFCQNFEFFAQKPEGRPGQQGKSLSETLFLKRLKLAQRLQNESSEADQNLHHLRKGLCNDLHQVVKHMDTHNFIVRTERRSVETFQQRSAWDQLSPDKALELSQKVAKLPSTYDLGSEAAKRFDNLILSLQTLLLERRSASVQESVATLNRHINTLQDKLMAIAEQLAGKASIPAVKAEMALIDEAQHERYWQDVSLMQLEELRVNLRGLMDYLDAAQKRETIYTNFKDEVGLSVAMPYSPYEGKAGLSRYRHKIQTYLKANQDHIALKRLKYNQPVTPQDISALEQMLFENEDLGDKVTFLQTFGEQAQLGRFIRSLIGLDREAAKAVFAEFLSNTAYNANQIRFIDEIINDLTQNGVMEIKRLYEPPYTHLHHHGIDGLFGDDDGDKIVEMINGVNRNAEIMR